MLKANPAGSEGILEKLAYGQKLTANVDLRRVTEGVEVLKKLQSLRSWNSTLRVILVLTMLLAPMGLVLAQDTDSQASQDQEQRDPDLESAETDEAADEPSESASTAGKRAAPQQQLVVEQPNRHALLNPASKNRKELGAARQLFPWLDSQEQCDQSCLFRRANDNLMLRMLYLQSRYELIQKGVIERKGKERDRFIQRELGPFCRAVGAGARAKAEECYTTYKQMAALELPKIYEAFSKNQQQIGALESRASPLRNPREIAFGVPAVARGKDPNTPEKAPYAPDVPRIDQLQGVFDSMSGGEIGKLFGIDQEGRTIEKLSRDFAEYVQSITAEPIGPVPTQPQAPVQSDYVLFRDIPRNPSDPGAGVIRIPDRTCGQAICYDEAAYAQAMRIFRGVKDDGTLGNRAEQVAERFDKYKDSVARAVEDLLSRGPAADLQDPRAYESIDQLTIAQEALYRARNTFISAAESAYGANNSEEMQARQRGKKDEPERQAASVAQGAQQTPEGTVDATLSDRQKRREISRPITQEDFYREIQRPPGQRVNVHVKPEDVPEKGLYREGAILNDEGYRNADGGYERRQSDERQPAAQEPEQKDSKSEQPGQRGVRGSTRPASN